MSDHGPAIIEVAVNGVPTDGNPNRPEGAQEIAHDALRCIDAGAAIVHTHIDDFQVDGERAAELYTQQYQPILAKRPDALVYPTIGFGETVAERMAHHARLVETCGLRVGLIDPGSVNLTTADAEGLPAATDFVYANSPADVHYIFELLGRLRLGPSMAIYEPTFLRYALAFERAGKLPPGALAKLYFGADHGSSGPARQALGFGLPPRTFSVDTYLHLLEGSQLPWAVTALGADVFDHDLARYALERGGHLRVGLEDYAGPASPSNLELVQKAAELAREVGRSVASPEKAARILGLPS